ncbi:hypothetical protein F4808DRAFT_196030 [Astrocystis sublimbata]|nr:hypothetical protein F4808DRAFT_196030 [Astrocystis sublimbata]
MASTSQLLAAFDGQPSHDINFLDHDYSHPDALWHLGAFPFDQQTSQQPSDHFDSFKEHQLSSSATCDHEHSQLATNYTVSPDRWSPEVPLDTAYDRLGGLATPPTAPMHHPQSPQHCFGVSTELPIPTKETEIGGNALFPMSPTSPEDTPSNSHTKRNRNRLAAAKCRKKAKRGVDDLQQKEQDLLRGNQMLRAEAGLLRDEVLRLKDEILRHSDCNNEYIQRYIQRCAEQIGTQCDQHRRRDA